MDLTQRWSRGSSRFARLRNEGVGAHAVVEHDVRMTTLDATHDKHGNDLRPGDYVQSYDFTFAQQIAPETAHQAWIEGTLVEIVERGPGGVPCYRIRTSAQFVTAEDGSVQRIQQDEHEVFPPVNGTPSALGGVTDGVERLKRP
jgi:hypothetical protein